jgi:polyphosphate kinase 2 (PPK2 family)
MIDKATCEKRYKHIEHFESLLSDNNTVILKCYLHISRDEQKIRLQERIDDPSKHWKLQASDFEDRKLWPDFMKAYEDAIAATSTKNAPWYIVPADSKPHRDLFIASLLVQTLNKLDLQMPEVTFAINKIKLD